MLLPYPKISFSKNRIWSVCPSTGASYSDGINWFLARMWLWYLLKLWQNLGAVYLNQMENFLAPNSSETSNSASFSAFSCGTPSTRHKSDFFSSAWRWDQLNCSVFPELKSSNVVGNTSAVGVSVFEKKKFFWWVFPFLLMCFVCCFFGFGFVFWFFFSIKIAKEPFELLPLTMAFQNWSTD